MAVQSRLHETGLTAQSGREGVGPALVFASVFTLLVLQGQRLLGDSDTQWHVAVGAWIWREKHVPWTDVFSHTFAGQPWIAKEWLSQLILFGAKEAAGWTGVVVLSALTAATVLSLLFAWLAARCRSTLALTLTMLAGVLIAPHCLARPHLFALLPLFVWTRDLVEAVEAGRPPPARLLGILVIWANLHGSFTIAYPIAAALALEAVLQASPERRREMIRRWAAFGALSLAAGCVTPYGVHALLVTFTVVGGGEALPFIIEWSPIGWTLMGFVSCTAAVAFATGLAADGTRNLARIALLVVLGAMMIRHSRFLDIFALVGPLLVATPLARRFPALGADDQPAPDLWPAASRVLLACLAFGAMLAVALRAPAPDPDVAPRAALAAARQAGVSGPVYNGYNFGGFLIGEGVPTFIDGRTDQLFLGGFISELYRLSRGDDDAAFVAFVARHGATWAIVGANDSDQRHFEASPGWSRLYRDDVASVYVKDLRGTLP